VQRRGVRQLGEADQVSFILRRHEAGGTTLNMKTPAIASSAYTPSAALLRFRTPCTPPSYLCDALPKPRLNVLKKRPKTKSMPRVRRSLGAWCGCSSTADSAGARVSEQNAEITVEM